MYASVMRIRNYLLEAQAVFAVQERKGMMKGCVRCASLGNTRATWGM